MLLQFSKCFDLIAPGEEDVVPYVDLVKHVLRSVDTVERLVVLDKDDWFVEKGEDYMLVAVVAEENDEVCHIHLEVVAQVIDLLY